MSSTTTNLGLVKMASGETIGQWSDANNGSGQNLDKIDTAIGTLNSQIANILKLSSPNLDNTTYPANSDTVVTVNSNWTNKRVVSISVTGEYPAEVNQKIIITSFWQMSNTLYICVRNITNSNVSGVLQVNIFYQETT